MSKFAEGGHPRELDLRRRRAFCRASHRSSPERVPESSCDFSNEIGVHEIKITISALSTPWIFAIPATAVLPEFILT